MPIEQAHSFLVHPGKGTDQSRAIGGTRVRLEGRLGEMLNRTYEKAPTQCNIEIAFRPDEQGRQHNAVLADLVRYVQDRTLPNGRRIAHRLESETTNRSKLGLLFVMAGTEQGRSTLVLSRFPADSGILAEEDRESLSVEFLERVFMKSAYSYKSAFYQSDAPERGFWEGRAIDRQISGGPKELSDYWIRDFLQSELRTTSAAGSKRLAIAFRNAIKAGENLAVRQELVAAATLTRGRDQRVSSARDVVQGLSLSPSAADALERQLPRADLMDDVFTFDGNEYARHLQYRMVELDNGAMLVAEDASFTRVFEQEVVDQARDIVRFSTEGAVVDEQLRPSK